ncbi:hypothetical protein BAU07_22420 [Bordetella flabilis]|uniref:Uncharacterized protein n=2 Tax=Bordetella flabilis TaxID=463014 RepID=A0A193GJC1_9BORD|nr:hypothetical protein BAU07_22420 [Bordetella flabilis]
MRIAHSITALHFPSSPEPQPFSDNGVPAIGRMLAEHIGGGASPRPRRHAGPGQPSTDAAASAGATTPTAAARDATGDTVEQNPGVRAYRALQASGHRLSAPLENDATLVVALARASSGLFAADVTASSLGRGQRRALILALAHELTRDIDWAVELGRDPAKPDAVFVDHGVVMGVSGQRIAAATAAVDARLREILQAHGLGALDTQEWIPVFRQACIADPTLALQPSPDILYGSRQWATLWVGMQCARAHGLTDAVRGIPELIALGQVAMSAPVDFGQAPPAGTAAPPASASGAPAPLVIPGNTWAIQALIRMAQAAGAVDLAELKRQDIPGFAAQLHAYALQHFAAELPLLNELQGVSRAAVAADLLQDAGIDPKQQIRVRSLVLAAPWGPLQIEIPLLFGSYRTSVHDYYMERDALSASDVRRLETTPKGAAVDADHARSRLPPSLKQEFQTRFESYKTAAAAYVGKSVATWLGTVPELSGADAGQAQVSISTARLRRYVWRSQQARILARLGPALSEYGPMLADISSKAFLVEIQHRGKTTRYLFDPGARTAMPLPADVKLEDWASDHVGTLFHGDPEQPTDGDASGNRPRKTVITLEPLASGTRAAMPSWLDPAIAQRIENTRASAAGQTISEKLAEAERGLLPFYATYRAIRDGDVRGAILSGLMDVATFLPAIGAGLKLGMTASAAIKAGLEAGLQGYAHAGMRHGLAMAGKAAGAFNGALAQLARHSLAATVDNVVTHPLRIISPSAMMGLREAEETGRLAAHMRATHPHIATALDRAASREAGQHVADGRWSLGAMPIAPSAPGLDIAPAPLYVTAVDPDGAELHLHQFGENAYSQFDADTLDPVGPLLLRGSNGKLYRSLPVRDLQLHRVPEPATLDRMRAERPRSDGTLVAQGKTYARLGTELVEIARDRAASVPGRTLWKVVEVPGPTAPAVRGRLRYDAEHGIWREADRPALKAGGNAMSAYRNMQARRRLRAESSEMAQQYQEIAHTFAHARYDTLALKIWSYPLRVRMAYPELVARSVGDHFIKGADGNIRRFPAGYVTHGVVVPGYAHMLDYTLLCRLRTMTDYSQLPGARVLAGYRLRAPSAMATFMVDDEPLRSLMRDYGVYELADRTYLISAPNLASDGLACENMLLAQGKPRDEVIEQLRHYDSAHVLDPRAAVNRIVRSLALRLCAVPLRLPFNGEGHDMLIRRLQKALLAHGPGILSRKGKMVMLDAIETDARGTWLVIRDPITCSRIRIPDKREFWEADDIATTATDIPSDWRADQVEAVFVPRLARMLERASASTSSPNLSPVVD